MKFKEKVFNNAFLKNNFGLYGVDIRAIKAFRFVFGMVMLFNLIYFKFGYFSEFYASKGILGDYFIQILDIGNSTIKNYFNTDFLLLLYFCLAALSYIFFALGWFFPFSGFFACFFYTTIQARFFPLSYGYDTYIIVIITTFILVPYSIQYAKKLKIIQPNQFEYKSIMIYTVLFQLAIVYFINGVTKYGFTWKDGEAVKLMIANTYNSKPNAYFLLQYPAVMHFLSKLTLIWEKSFLLLMFIPFFSKYLRLLLAISLISFHWGVDIFVEVGYFKWVGTACAILLIPDFIWNKIYSNKFFIKINQFISQLEIRNLYDILPNWYNKSIYFLVRRIFPLLSLVLLFVIIERNLYVISKLKFPLGEKMKNAGFVEILEPIQVKLNKRTFVPKLTNQRWELYAPNVQKELGYIKLIGITKNNKEINLTELDPNIKENNYKCYSRKLRQLYMGVMKFFFVSTPPDNVDFAKFRALIMYEAEKYNRNNFDKINSVNIVLYSLDGREFIKNQTFNFKIIDFGEADLTYQ